MNKVVLRLGLAIAVLAATAAVALAAATPKLGGTYVGKTSHNRAVRIVLDKRAQRNGTIKGLFILCGAKFHISVVHGHFGIHTTTAGGLVSTFRAKGSWSSRTIILGEVDLDFTSNCQGLPGPFSAALR